MPKPPQCGSEIKEFSRTRTSPTQCRTEIIVIRFKRGERCGFMLDPLCVSAFSDAEIMHKMATLRVLLFANLGETFGAVLP